MIMPLIKIKELFGPVVCSVFFATTLQAADNLTTDGTNSQQQAQPESPMILQAAVQQQAQEGSGTAVEQVTIANAENTNSIEEDTANDKEDTSDSRESTVSEDTSSESTSSTENSAVTDAQITSEDRAALAEQANNVSAQIEQSMETIETTHGMLEALTKEIENNKETSASTRTRMQKITESLQTIDQKLLEAYDDLNNSRSGIQDNAVKINSLTDQLKNLLKQESNLDKNRLEIEGNLKKIEELSQNLTDFSRDIRANSADLSSQKSLIEDNSIRLYELLIQLQEVAKKLSSLSSALEKSKQDNFTDIIKQAVDVDLNRLWLLLSTVLVFFAPLGFVLSSSQRQGSLLADGTDERQGMILACLGVFLGYFVLGFGLMYGPSASGWFGIPTHLIQFMAPPEDLVASNFRFTEFVLYKTGFAMFGALIVYTAAGQKLSSVKHMLLALFVGAILVPIYGHWVTSGHYVTTNPGWLQSAGFIDQAGANTINTVTGWFALIVCWKIGGTTKQTHETPKTINESNDPVYSSSATLLLWLSWLGFTTGMLPISSDQISSVMLNAGLAASAGGITAFMQYVFFNADKNAIARGLAGFVSGLVAIAACAQSVTFIEAAFIGAIAGLLQNIAYRLLRKWFLNQDWQVKAAFLVAIHGVAGIWGALCFALLGTEGNFSSPNLVQLTIQIQGVAAAVIYSIIMANIAVFILRLRQKPAVDTVES